MLTDFLSSGLLNLIYAGVVLTSFIFAVIILVGAEVGDVFDFDVDADTDAGLDFISISPFALSMFGAAFGFTGLVTRLWLEMTAVPSIIWSVVVGILVGGVAQLVFIYILSPTKSGHVRLSTDVVGQEAEVITTIPANGLGEIAFDSANGRIKLGARSATGKQIKNGQLVIIEKIVGRVALVRPSAE
ncbi:MAG: hypothetical protein D6706_20575 [Chloroflexi bacterium]|nr:MAG: hypothetical protein D6706_20575 [Chloroflexota bacterium]